MQDRWLQQPQLRLSQDLHDARWERLLPAPIRMHHACNQVRRKLHKAHQEGKEGLKGKRIESSCARAFKHSTLSIKIYARNNTLTKLARTIIIV